MQNRDLISISDHADYVKLLKKKNSKLNANDLQALFGPQIFSKNKKKFNTTILVFFPEG